MIARIGENILDSRNQMYLLVLVWTTQRILQKDKTLGLIIKANIFHRSKSQTFERSLEVSKIKHYRSLLIDAGDNQIEYRVNEKLHDLIKISRNRVLMFDAQNM